MKKKTIKAWAITKRGIFSHVEMDEADAKTWKGFKVVPCIITFTL